MQVCPARGRRLALKADLAVVRRRVPSGGKELVVIGNSVARVVTQTPPSIALINVVQMARMNRAVKISWVTGILWSALSNCVSKVELSAA